MYISETLAPYLGLVITWGMLMAFLFNLITASLGNSKRKLTLIVSLVMFLSYWSSDPFINLLYRLGLSEYDFMTYHDYLVWMGFDIVTLLLVMGIWRKYKKGYPDIAARYVMAGLSFNTLAMLLIYLDLAVRKNNTPWWLWSFYSLGVNLSDLLMISALTLQRDVLGLIHLTRKFSKRPA